ncbi:hypothetical protein T439DRAFT_334799 [Meredithblackwellia eburnea MCA 4105]
MPAFATSANLVARKVAQTKSDKLEKSRQSLASLHISNAYQFILVGIVGLLLLRNIAYKLRAFAVRRRQNSETAITGSSEKGPHTPSPASSLFENESFFYRALGKIDSIGSGVLGVRFLPADCTLFRLALSVLILAVNLTFCLIIDTHLITVASVNSNVARAFSRRCGRIAVANYPILFALAGRNNVVSLLTGFAYTEVRYYHKLLGSVVVLESFIHTIAYTGYYIVSLGHEALAEEATELYFKWGIAATVMMCVMAFTAMSFFRNRLYEIFLLLHVAGAAVTLAGSFYHRPIIQPWVYAATAVWVFERVARLARHLGTIFHRRLMLRSPVLQAEAQVLHGAIILTIPFRGTWEAAQHCYISFWSPWLLATPWLYGQSHPFSISNVQPSTASTDQHIRFVMRIKNGVTRTLANHIQKRTRSSGKETCSLSVMAEGPYGQIPPTSDYDSVLLLAGGSGITQLASTLGDVVQKAAEGHSFVKDVHLVWAIHHLNQSEWLGDSLENIRSRADEAKLNLRMDVYVTRPGASTTSSKASSIDESRATTLGSPSIDEKKAGIEGSVQVLPRSRLNVFHGRPAVGEIMRDAVGRSIGHTFITACGPASLADTVRNMNKVIGSPTVAVSIAKFQC